MSDPALPDGVERREVDGEERLATRGEPVYGEPTADGWRAWDPERSKLGGMLELGLETGLTGGETVLYLGAASGTTVSHVADFAGPTYAVEFAPRPARDLLDAAEPRDRLFPLLKDARKPDTYAHVVEADVDAVVQDVATRGQADVAVRNAEFLTEDGRLLLAIKARSEDVTAAPEAVFEGALDRLRDAYEILETRRLDRFHEDHLGVVATPK
ncbi:fibrillarin-like rRNA/tRNA 2'-O-methyltransferase [Halorubrum distributum]|uniref:Fibrillarin-like rRNA/tRNA 2'-O-methyltransferase n=2 Tax=Halorubrum distributum TaxID=29283 RepID=M0NYG7_9EURY|nr:MULTISPECIES: fibrillarin-like rRNA/tRNA 2'-O-methyltransferase [Halorubrum distributum group]EMA62613.1 fibrillarin [Halorubrum litoreum JCM 13561]MDV7348443.1 fibrillarin-like rRNA/tRNA 2'-O-methyltransferase [Halorubrum distributum]MYL17596.1 fibrillarin-like rRNA/tRNA 2'-O-methyltransferase [Halorubrum terrestre]MYL68165.1 fibrillarin-like rRNA/tRNA 2'-O-methyltransferase [Halorubrum terrestre]